MKRPRYRTVALVIGLLGGSFIGASACSNNGEGERCEFNNNNDDCDTTSGLICTQAAQLNDSVSDRCCPADRTKASVAVCQTPINVGIEGGPADTGAPTTADATVSDAATDASDAADAPNDG